MADITNTLSIVVWGNTTAEEIYKTTASWHLIMVENKYGGHH